MVPVRVGHAYIVDVPEMPEMQALAERLSALLAGMALRRGGHAQLLFAQDLRPGRRIPCRAGGSSRSGGGPSTWSGTSRVGPVSSCTCPRRVASTSNSHPRRRSPGARWCASSSARVRPDSTGRAWASSCVSTARSARRRGGCWRRGTRAPCRGWGPKWAARPSPSSSARATRGATSRPTCATSTWWPASGGVGGTTSSTGPSCRRSPRCAR